MNTLTEAQLPTTCEVAGVRMPLMLTWVCGNSPVTHTLDGRIYNTDKDQLTPIRMYICASCALRYTRDPQISKVIDIIPLTEYTF